MELCQGKTVSEIAQLSNASASSIIRIVQKLGFKGYSEFRYFLRNELDRKDRASVINTNKIGSSVVLEDVTSTIRLFEQNKFIEDIYKLMATSNRIYAYATGYGQSLMLKEFSRCLINVGIHLIIIPGQIELNLISNTLKPDDLFLGDYMYTMKQACELTKLSYETLKFYCNEGLVPIVKRDKKNHVKHSFSVYNKSNLKKFSLNCSCVYLFY